VRLGLARTRLLASAALGAGALSVLAARVPWQMAVLAAWSTTAAAMVAWVLSAVLPRDEVGTASIATKEDNSRFTTDVLLVSACVASLIGVGFALVKAANEHGMAKAVTTGLAVLSVVLSWAVVHVVYLLHYARLYYEEDGGIQFIGEKAPDYRDFAYLAFTIGMTYQVSDTDLTSRPIRRAATHHALLSYLFGTVIVAMMINVVASLLR
jgi:uncharacterized membrane protein